MLRQVDLNKDGFIQFTEFMIAGCNKYDICRDENLRSIFSKLDADRDGLISIQDYEFAVRGFNSTDTSPFIKTEEGKDWRAMLDYLTRL